MKQKIKNLITHRKDRGFTLIELAMVLVVIGLLIGLGASMLGPLTKRAKYIETKDIVNAAVESVISFSAANNRLPCEANDNSGNVCGPPGNRGDEFTPTVRSPNDAWTKPLYYIYDNNLTDPSIGGVCGRKTTNVTVRICPNAACAAPTSIINNVAFIILSGSENYNNQTAGTQGITSATNINVYDADVVVDNYDGDMNRPEPYDDIVKWITLDELRIKTGCVGPQLKILNNELPHGRTGTLYSAVVFADGGVPYIAGGRYSWCRQDPSPIAGLTFNPPTLSADCLTLAEASWQRANNLTISGTPTVVGGGSFIITFFVRDNNDSSGNNDNIAQKTFVLTISP